MKNKEFLINVLFLSLLVVLVGILNIIDYEMDKHKEVSIVSYVSTVDEPVIDEDNKEEDPIVYDGLTMNELIDKLNRSLKSDLAGTGAFFAKYSLEYGVDPYLAVAISLHESGCNRKCDIKVTECNNVGGQKFKPACAPGSSYGKYDTLELGIKGFIRNIYVNYIAMGLDTPLLMQDKYVGTGSKTWAPKVEHYIELIKAA